ncbi:MAG: primase, DNA, polypeptide 1 (49kDa) [Paramarteilia canceri]
MALVQYYKSHFPAELICNWLRSNKNEDSDNLNRREIAFTLENEVFLRYLSFQDAEALRTELIKKKPQKIHIGPAYTESINSFRLVGKSGVPIKKELVFDIDLTDYEEIRSCCSGAKICDKCWNFINVAIEVISDILIKDFNALKFVWVFSGRRGVHCWISDEIMKNLNNEARSTITDYFNVFDSDRNLENNIFSNRSFVNENKLKEVSLHPTFERVYQIMKNWFVSKILKEQILSDQKSIDKFLSFIECNILKTKINDAIKSNSFATHIELWREIEEKIIPDYYNSSKKTSATKLIKEIVFRYCYPRLDLNVTKSLTHLLKVPFCIHPSTQLVCVPIDHRNLSKFDFKSVPSLKDMSNEGANKENQNFSENLKNYIDFFNHFVSSL